MSDLMGHLGGEDGENEEATVGDAREAVADAVDILWEPAAFTRPLGPGHLIICHSYGGRLSDCQLCGGNYKNVLENSNSPNILPFLLTWHARSASQLGNGPLTLEDRSQKTILPPPCIA